MTAARLICTLLVSAAALQLPSFTTKKATTLRSSVDDAAWPRPKAPPLLQTLGISRDRALKSLATLDRGEFRWEFLTPWVDRDLTRTDKVIVCSTFIGLAIVSQELIEPSTALAQHLSYVATFFSYAAGDQVVYRAIAILASLLEIFAYGVEDGAFLLREDAIPEGYNIIFIIVNSYYVLRWALNRSDMVGLGLLDATETELYKRCFEPLGVGAYQYVKLLRDAVWCAPTDETPLTVEGEPVTQLFVSVSGDFDVVSGGRRVATLPEYQVIGEVALLENLQSKDGAFHQAARATVLAEPGSRYVAFSQKALYELQLADEAFAAAMRLAIARTLSHKLGAARASTGALLAQRNNEEGEKEAVVVRKIMKPDDERLFQSTFAKLGVGSDAFAALCEAAAPVATDGDALMRTVIREDSAAEDLVVLESGGAAAFVDGVRVQAFEGPALLNAEQVLEGAIVGGSSPPLARATVVLDEGSVARAWTLRDLRRLVRRDAAVAPALRACYDSLLRERGVEFDLL